VNPSDEEIAAMTDPVLRNLHITQRYHEFAVQLRDGGIGEDATWCAFAVWASKTAGATIRGEVLPERAKQLMADNEATGSVIHRFNSGVTAWAKRHLTHDHLGQAVEAVTAEVSKSIAAGNVLVFSELAPLFTALLDAHASSSPPSRDALGKAFAPALAQAESSGEGADGVTTAFGAYADALFAPPDSAAVVLQANTLAVAHEQHRLQPAIQDALDAAITDTLQKVVDDDVVDHVPAGEGRHLLGGLTADVCKVLETAWDTALTEVIMRLVTATESLDLRRDVPALPGGMFPPALADLGGTAAAGAVAQWDKTGGTGVPSGAHDWAQLPERMNYIVNLFRSRQRDPSLFNPPFSEEQLQALNQGRLPAGPL
jgi:hypothetical protein